MPDSFKSPATSKQSVKSNPVPRTHIIIKSRAENKHWHDTASIPFDTYLKHIKSLKKSDFHA